MARSHGNEPGPRAAQKSAVERLASRPAGWIKIERNLASLGFFTPSSKRIRSAKRKTIAFAQVTEGRRLEARASILPSAEYGLPITADQDRYFALQKIIMDLRRRHGRLRNPIGFTSADLLRILGRRVSAGKNYDDIYEWMQRMMLTGINSEGMVYLAGRKIWATDRFQVFERVISYGSQMPDGTVATKNYIWLSEWQLENINHNHLLQVNLDAYRQLRNHIAKAIVPLLQIWSGEAREAGRLEKGYGELCQILNIACYRHGSKIRETLAPSLDELKARGYLADWRIEKTEGSPGYNVILTTGRGLG